MALDPQRFKELFLSAAEIPSPSERAAFLQRECGEDAELRRQLDILLQAHDDSGGFLASKPTSDHSSGANGQTQGGETVGEVIGPYKLLQKLGEGGMGAVWVAEQTQPVKRRVALKLIKPGMDSRQVLRRFEQERQALALMDHTSIAKVFDAGTTTQGRPYFVMELVKGVPITKYCDELNLPIRERLALFIPVCQAIQHAHQKGIIHRDIKPSNVLVCMQDGKPVPKIIDFGIAKAASQRLTDASLYTEVGQVIGTLEYMSPEQAELSALDIDTRADIYALGAMLYELLTGTTPLDRRRLKQAALMELLRIIKEQEPPRPSTRLSESQESLPSIAAQRHSEPARLTREVRGELDWIVMKCLEKDRTRRYETASGLARDVERYLADEPVEACPPSRTYRLGKLARKYRATLTVAAVFVLLLASAAAVSSWLAVRATEAEGLANTRLEDVSKEKARADEETRIATAVNEFLQGLLSQADIANQSLLDGAASERNPNVTVRELLDRAAEDIKDKFADQPLTEASIRSTMGDAYHALGRYAEARPHMERALQLRMAKLGANHPDTLHSKHSLATLSYAQGQFATAETIFKQVLQERTAKLGANHPDTLHSKNDLAVLYFDQGQYTKAETLYKEALQDQMVKRGADHPDTLQSKHNLAVLYEKQGQYAKAETLHKEALEAQTAKLGADHPQTLISKSNLATLYQSQGQYARAETLLTEVRDVWTAKVGADHPSTLDTKSNLARLYHQQAQYAKAETLFKEVLDGQTAKLGANHPKTLNSKHNLALLLQSQRQYAKAETLFTEVLEGQTAKLGADHPSVLNSKCSLAGLYRDLGQYAKAEPLFKEVLEGQTAKLGADHPNVLTSKGNLAVLYDNQRQYAKAEALYKEALQGLTAKLGADHPYTLFNKNNLAALYWIQTRYAEAEPLFTEVLQGRTAKLGADHPDTLMTKNTLARLYRSQRQYAKAEALYKEALQGRTAKLGTDHPLTLITKHDLALLYEEQRQFAKAEPLYKELAAIYKDEVGADSLPYAGQLADLANNLLLQHKAAEAEPILRECLAIRQKGQPDNWTTFNAQMMLGAALLFQKKYTDAEPLLRQGYEGLKERQDKLPPHGKPRLLVALNLLVQLCEATDKKAEAAKWRKELQALQAKMPGGKP